MRVQCLGGCPRERPTWDLGHEERRERKRTDHIAVGTRGLAMRLWHSLIALPLHRPIASLLGIRTRFSVYPLVERLAVPKIPTRETRRDPRAIA
jgi:hypothetical protein